VSNQLAFAHVTEALRGLLEAVAKPAVSGAVGTAERPDTLKDDAPRVNVFLFQVTPNGAWRNADVPTRRQDGTVARRPQAAFDLHYMVSLYGSDKQSEPQRLLGAVVSLLHSQPVLSPAILEAAATGTLAASDLAAQAELVRVTPTGFSLEEMSKLWSVFFQVPYKLSIAYQASVVLIEPEVAVQPALPVRDRNLYVAPFRRPEVDEVVNAAGAGLPILPGDVAVLRGRNLLGPATRVRVAGVEVTPARADVRDAEVRVALATPPFPAGALAAGVLGAQVVQLELLGTPPVPHACTESNVAPFVLHPRIKTVGPNPDVSISAATGDVRTVTVGIEPQVSKDQRAVLLLNEPVTTNPRSFSALAERRANDTDPVVFKVRGLVAGTDLLVRVQIDGAESPLDAAGGAFGGPKVRVPP